MEWNPKPAEHKLRLLYILSNNLFVFAENEYDKKLGKFPGLRKSKNGGYYFVDFVNPDGLMKKPQEKY